MPLSTPKQLVRCSAIECSASWEKSIYPPCPGFLKKKSLGSGGLSYHRIELRTGQQDKGGLLAGAKPCLEADPTRLGTTACKPSGSLCTPCSPRHSGCFLQVFGYLRNLCYLQAMTGIAGRSSRRRLAVVVHTLIVCVCLLFRMCG